MVEILAIVKRAVAQATREELARIGCLGYSQWPVLGRGRQRGLGNAQGQPVLPFLPKIAFSILVDDEQRAETIEAIIRAGQTGQYGDGKIFVLDVLEGYRISTGEQDGGLHAGSMTQEAHP